MTDEGGFVDTRVPTGVRTAASANDFLDGGPSGGTVRMMLQSPALLIVELGILHGFEQESLSTD